MQLSLARTPMSKCRYAGFLALRMCTEFPGISPPGTGGVGGSECMPYSSLQGGLSIGGVIFSYKPRTPGSRGIVHRGGHFQLQTAYSRFRGGVVHGGVLFQLQTAYSRFRRGGCPWGGAFSATNCVLLIPAEKARPARRDFRGITPELVYRFSGGRRACPAGPGNPGPEHPGQAVLRTPGGPF